MHPVHIAPNLLKNLPRYLSDKDKTIILISDSQVSELYTKDLEDILINQGYRTLNLSFPAGEAYKTQETKSFLENKLLEQACGKDSLILAIGGGVVGDLAGFIAATYMRGIPYIQVPTTLLAMVDSSIGGKTAINTPYGKNLIGAFWQPEAVIADISCLKTLSDEHIINGLIEAFKIFLTSDAKSFHYFSMHRAELLKRNPRIYKELIEKAVYLKALIVAKDTHEKGLRKILNFGHTLGHALEAASNYEILHGYAVGYGILLEAKIAESRGLLSTDAYECIAHLFNDFNIKFEHFKRWDLEALIDYTHLDKKNSQKETHYVILDGIGRVFCKNGKFTQVVEDEVVRGLLVD